MKSIISKFQTVTAHGIACLAVLLTLAACATPAPVPESSEVVAEPEPVFDAQSAVARQRELEDAERHRRYVADILYSGLRALRADRLMTPPEDSAFHYFNRALALDPGNTVAEEGLQDILQRYLQLADTASWQGQFDNAELFLRRAADVDDQHPGIQVARDKLQLERQRTHSVYRIDSGGLRSRHEDVVRQLQDVAAVLAANDIFVLITAPSDETGRWIYAQLQDALSNQRVRADIEIGEQASVRLVLSQNS